MITEPKSMAECLYFTNRDVGKGWVKAWAYRILCTVCKKRTIGRPIKKNGKVDKKASYYECSDCKKHLSNEEGEKLAKIESTYQCPHCGKEGSGEGPYTRKSYQGILSFLVECEHCHTKIAITKKLKKSKDADD